ncbi:MAG: hypothetical protein Fur0046_16230 [Cyanobacteria bacterium J069]|nr:MAG: ADP-ribosylglycohydrolase family protein [Cyanobacteria bacterium J069]
MGDRLLDQFQGALRGAALGHLLGANAQSRQSPDWRQVDSWGFGLPAPQALAMNLGKSILTLGESLIQQPRLAVDLSPAVLADPSALAIATLPLALYHHDHPNALRSQLSRLGAPAASLAVAQVFGTLLSRTLHPDMQPQTLISEAIAALDLTAQAPDLTTALQQVHRLAHQERLAIARPALAEEIPEDVLPLCTALYGFLSTPEYPTLAMRRAARISASPLTSALAGSLCGARSGSSGLPAAWRMQAGESRSLASFWGVEESALNALAAGLLASWAGVYLPNPEASKTPHPTWVVAAAGKLRPR